MAESCTNRESHEKALCDFQIRCSSEVNSNEKTTFNHDCKGSMMEGILLPRDIADSGCDLSGYKKTLSSDDYADKSGQNDLTSNCKDSKDSHRAISDIQNTMLFSKESAHSLSSSSSSSCPLDYSNPAKRSMSSAFMISSILSTKPASSFSTVLSQASSSKPSLKVTDSSSTCVPASVPIVSNTKQGIADALPVSLKKVGSSDVNLRVGYSKREALEATIRQLQSNALSKQEQKSLVDKSAEVTDVVQGKEISPLKPKNENSLMPMQSKLDTPIFEDKSGIMGKVGSTDKTVDRKQDSSSPRPQSSKRSLDCCSDVDNVNVKTNTSDSQNSSSEDILIIEDDSHTISLDEDLESSSVALDVKDIKTMEDAADSGLASLTHDKSLEDSEVVNNNRKSDARQESSSNNVINLDKNEVCKKSTSTLSSSTKYKYFTIVDNYDAEDSNNLDNEQNPPRLEWKSLNYDPVVANKKNELNLDVKIVNSEEESISILDLRCEKADNNNSCPGNVMASDNNNERPASAVLWKKSELSKPRTLSEHERNKTASSCEKSSHLGVGNHSKNVKHDFRIDDKSDCADSPQVDLSEIKPLENKAAADRILELQDKDVVVKTEILDKSVDKKPILKGKEILSNNKTVGSDEVLCIDDNGESDAVQSSDLKFSFKNILRIPKDKILHFKKSPVIKEEKGCLKSAATVVEGTVLQNKPLANSSAVNGKGRDEQHADLKMATNPTLGDTLHTSITIDIDVDDSEQNFKSTGDRKRCQKEDFSSSKRPRLDTVDAKDEKEVKTLALVVKSDDVIPAVKPVAPLTEDKDVSKQKDDTGITMSNEALQTLITLRLRAFIKKQKLTNLDRLNLRTRGMQSASNLWKETAKHLERSVLELAALNQKLESRKAHFLAVKRLASKSIGVQVIEEAVSSSGSSAQSIPSSSSTQRTSPISTPAPRTQNRPGRPPLYGRTASNIPATPQQERKIQPISGKPQDAPVTTVNLIDLTDDEETSRNSVTKTSASSVSQSVNHSVNKNVIPAPGNGYVQPVSLTQALATTSLSTNKQIVQSTASGLQPQSSSNLTSGAPGSQFQLVSNTPTQQSSPAHASKAAATTNNYTSSGQSNTSANTNTLPQNSAPSVTPTAAIQTTALSLPPSFLISNNHPAPLPNSMDTGNAPPTAKKRPPKPSLKISRVTQGIVLSWNMPPLFDVEKISSYQLYAYQESDLATPKSCLWKKVGEVTALPLPMACTLTQFQEGNKYHFAVRAVDQYGRWGTYSDPSSIYLGPKA